MSKSLFHKLLVMLCVLLSVTLLICACDTEEPNPNETPTPTPAYEVTVTDASNTPLQGATVALYLGNTAKATATTDASGVASFDIEDGIYTVKVTMEGYIAEDSYFFPTDSKELTVKLTADTKATYTVTVVDWNNTPLAGITVQMCIGDLCRWTLSDANGVATFKVDKATYDIKIITSDYAVEEHYNFEEGATSTTITLYPPQGTELNPIWFAELENNSITIGAGETVYYAARVVGASMTLTGSDVTVLHDNVTYTAEGGVLTIAACAGDMYSPSTFVITNNSDAKATYTVSFAYPEGDMSNPASLVMGTNSATTESGYFYTYTATAAGTLTITIDSACTDWNYTINNQTTMRYGTIHASGDDTVVASESVTVAAGDKIQIVIGTDSNNEGTVTFTATFVAAA